MGVGWMKILFRGAYKSTLGHEITGNGSPPEHYALAGQRGLRRLNVVRKAQIWIPSFARLSSQLEILAPSQPIAVLDIDMDQWKGLQRRIEAVHASPEFGAAHRRNLFPEKQTTDAVAPVVPSVPNGDVDSAGQRGSAAGCRHHVDGDVVADLIEV